MTFSTMKKIFISSMFIALFASQGGLGAEKEIMDNATEGSAAKLSVATEKSSKELISDFAGKMRAHAVTTCYKNWDASVLENGSAPQDDFWGDTTYLVNKIKKGTKPEAWIKKQVMSIVNDDDYKNLLTAELLEEAQSLGLIKKPFWDKCEDFVGSRLTNFLKAGTAIVAVVALAGVPVAAAVQTVSYQPAAANNLVSTAAPGAPHCRAASTATPGQAIMTWTSTGGDVLASAVTATTSSTPFTASLVGTPPGVSSQPCVACPLNDITNPCLVSWFSGGNVQGQFLFPNGTLTGTTAFLINSVVSTSTAGLNCARFSDDSLGVVYGHVTAGANRISFRVYSSQVANSPNPLVLSNTPTLVKGSPSIVDLGTTPSTALVGWEGVNGANNVIYKARFTTSTGAIIEAENAISSDAQVQTEVSALSFTDGQSGLLWRRGSSAAYYQIFASNGSPVGTPQQLTGTTGQIGKPIGIGTPDGNAFVTVATSTTGTYFINGAVVGSNGTLKTPLQVIPFNPTNGQTSNCPVLLKGGTTSNYNVLAGFDDTNNAGVERISNRVVNVATSSWGGRLEPLLAPTALFATLLLSFLL